MVVAKGDNRNSSRREKDSKQKEYEEKLLEVRKVTKVTRGGRRLGFRATMLVGNKKGSIGIGTSSGKDVSIAVKKALHVAYKNLTTVPLTEEGSVPYPMTIKHKACRIKFLPAAAGTGLKAGSSVRNVLDLAGYTNILSKIVGSNNKLNNALATLHALSSYKVKSTDNASSKKKDNSIERKEPTSENDKNTSSQGKNTSPTKKTTPKKTASKKTSKTEETSKTTNTSKQKTESAEKK